IGLAVWSAMTVASGLARSFTQLALARIGVGVGEAAGSPPAHSLISDYFPPERRARALAIYAWGVYIGSALAYLGGGYLRAHFDWRMAFIVLGIPGLLFALVVRFTVREPPRGFSEHAAGPAQANSLSETLRHLLSCRSWVHLVVGSCFLSVTGYGILLWGFEFYTRVHGLPPFEIGIWMAAILGIGGSAGAYAGGALADRFGPRNPVWYMRLPAIVTLVGVPFGFVFLLAGSSRVSMLFFFVFYVLSNVYVPIMHTLNQNLSRLRMRATAAAILLFIINLVGAGAGPFLVGFLNDQFAVHFGTEAIRYSMLTLASMGILGAFFFHLSSRSLAGDLAKLEA
ncbi:MAG: MFS transporter, partial [Myxococcota bacterium]|nr:MFS transporter [Myxococcota bacterium]